MKVAIVDDNQMFGDTLKKLLISERMEADYFENGSSFVSKCENPGYDIVITDIMLPDINGYDLIKYLKAHKSKARIIAVSVFDKKELNSRFQNIKADYVINKPFEFNQLMQILQNIQNQSFYIDQFLSGTASDKNIMIIIHDNNNMINIPDSTVMINREVCRMSGEKLLLIDNLQLLPIDQLKSFIISNLDMLNDNSVKTIISYNGSLHSFKEYIFNIPGIAEYIIDRAFTVVI